MAKCPCRKPNVSNPLSKPENPEVPLLRAVCCTEPHWSHRQPSHSALATLEFCLIVNFIFSQRTPLSRSASPGTRVSGEAAESLSLWVTGHAGLTSAVVSQLRVTSVKKTSRLTVIDCNYLSATVTPVYMHTHTHTLIVSQVCPTKHVK